MADFLKKILWATDFSEESEEAFAWANLFARVYNSSLIALHVVPDFSPFLYRDSYLIGEELRQRVTELRNEAAKRLERFQSAKKASYKIFIKEGTPAKKIVETAEEENADLIVMGRKGLSALEKLLIGSVANQVLRSTSVPVLVTKKRKKKRLIKKILVPTDFSPQEEIERDFAWKLARGFGAELIFLHVLELHDYEFSPRVLDEMFKALMTRLKKRRKKEGEDIKVSEEVVRAVNAALGIVEFAEEKEVDLIVLSTYVQSHLERFFLGSTTEKVISHSTLPVFAIPPERKK
ncbi:MAG: universal stress protein [Candidatus Aminicenantales bacterium]